MKNIYRFLAIGLFLLLNISCSVKRPMLYHSLADLPYSSKLNFTNFELLKIFPYCCDDFNFGIIVATDNEHKKYILIAPGRLNQRVNDLPDVDIDYAVTILPKYARKLLKILNYSIENWNKKIAKLRGVNVEFIIAPEHKIIKKSENVEQWYPCLRYYYQNNSEGSLATLILGEDNFIYRFDKFDDISRFRDLFEIAVNKLKN